MEEQIIIGVLVYDPVCGEKVNTAKAEMRIYNGKAYYFCCEECADEFMKDPAFILGEDNEQ